ncbi:MAG: hypothetical protein M1831_006212 [Alyxoria varia]|nr:MAG: hypothetical protein M1831_006212 [Alyxoria varia]
MSGRLSFVALAALLPSFLQAEKASFTTYGGGDIMGSANCATAVNACGTPNQSGYTAALSESQFGVGPGAGAGPACGKCYQLTIDSDSSGAPMEKKTITVTVNNLCPVQGNAEWCQVPNQHGAGIHFDLCSDTGAADAFFTGSKAGLGTAEEVSCGGGGGGSQNSTESGGQQEQAPQGGQEQAPQGGQEQTPPGGQEQAPQGGQESTPESTSQPQDDDDDDDDDDSSCDSS